MKTLLVTGLDGSGKSTIFNRLRENNNDSKYFLIFLPYMDTESFSNNKDLYRVAKLLNALNSESDRSYLPHLKAFALFGSMLLFRKIIESQYCLPEKLIICERHPLIDTGIYARFYRTKLKTPHTNSSLFSDLDSSFPFEMDYLIQLIPPNKIEILESRSESLMNFMMKWFSNENNFRPNALKTIFQVELPDHIYYLNANPDLLFDRLKNREIHEAHESIEVLQSLAKQYQLLFESLKLERNVFFENIDANTSENLDSFYHRLVEVIKYY